MEPRPVFEHPDLPEQSRRRFLLISYHFPPDTSIGARRWETLAHFVRERGWGLDVIMRGGFRPDRERMQRLPCGVRVYEVPAPVLAAKRLEHAAHRMLVMARGVLSRGGSSRAGSTNGADTPVTSTAGDDDGLANLARLTRFPREPRDLLRAYWAWVDHAYGRAWARSAAQVGLAIHRPGVHGAVISSGPPHMTHYAARDIARHTGLPFVMDMRDPWSQGQQLIDELSSPVWLVLARRHERRLVRDAALVVANTEPARDALRAVYPRWPDRFIAVLNGSDDYPIPPARHGHRFVIAFAGTIYIASKIRSLFRGAARAIERLGLTPEEFGFEFMGVAQPIARLAREEGIAAYVTEHPRSSHAAALEMLAGGAMLPVFGWPRTNCISAKTFEVVRFDAWVLALATPGSATECLLRGTGADIVPPHDIERIADTIVQRYQEYRRGLRPTRIARVRNFERREQARILLDAIERCAGSPLARG